MRCNIKNHGWRKCAVGFFINACKINGKKNLAAGVFGNNLFFQDINSMAIVYTPTSSCSHSTITIKITMRGITIACKDTMVPKEIKETNILIKQHHKGLLQYVQSETFTDSFFWIQYRMWPLWQTQKGRKHITFQQLLSSAHVFIIPSPLN